MQGQLDGVCSERQKRGRRLVYDVRRAEGKHTREKEGGLGGEGREPGQRGLKNLLK